MLVGGTVSAFVVCVVVGAFVTGGLVDVALIGISVGVGVGGMVATCGAEVGGEGASTGAVVGE